MCFSLIWLLSRDRRPHSLLRKCICVCCHSQRLSEDVAVSVRNFARGKLPVSVGGSGHWMLLSMSLLCFLFSPALTCTCQRYIQIHPAFGPSLYTLCPPFVLQLREKNRILFFGCSDSLGISWEVPWSLMHSVLIAKQSSFCERRSVPALRGWWG